MNATAFSSQDVPVNPAYPPAIWRLFAETPRAGRFPTGAAGVRVAEATTPAARAHLRLSVRLEADRIVDARFQAFGCPWTIATGAWLAGWSIGRTLAQTAALTAAEVAAALEIPDDRAHCSLMAEDVVRGLSSPQPGIVTAP